MFLLVKRLSRVALFLALPLMPVQAYGQELFSGTSDESAIFPDAVSKNNSSQLGSVQPKSGSVSNNSPLNVERSEMPSQVPEPLEEDGEEKPPVPFGAQLFASSNFIDSSLSINDDYEIVPGDRVSIKMWGAKVSENVYAVDLEGNIFVPEIGPVNVLGIKSSQLSALVERRVSKVYTNNVKVYSSLVGTQPIGVFVTGYVEKPGRYPGTKIDSLLYYLARAGGISFESGSYRNVQIKRAGKVLETIDLYQFLISGDMPNLEFQNNDVVVVGQQFPTVTVTGLVKNAYRFEIDPNSYSVADVMRLANPKGSATHVLIEGHGGTNEVRQYTSLKDLASVRVAAGDKYTVEKDRFQQKILVKVFGNSKGNSTLAINRSLNLGTVANLIAVNPATHDLSAIHLRRKSVADRQKQAIEQSLYELQRSVLTGSSSSATGSAIRIQEAQLIDRFVQQVRTVEPEGRVVLAGVDWSGVKLEDGDEIVIPEKSDVVLVSGEVKVPQTVLWREGYSSEDYISAAGGVSNRGDGDRLIIIRVDGSVHNGDEPIKKGDHMMVLPEIDTKLFAVFKDLIEITYRVALSAAVVLDAND